VGDRVIRDPVRNSSDNTQEYEVCPSSFESSRIRCKPVSGGPEESFYSFELQVVPKPAPVEDVKAVWQTIYVFSFSFFLILV
jgi:hypothetical protein